MIKELKIYNLLSFFIPYISMINYNLNHFYRSGGYYWDSGEFAYYASSSNSLFVTAPPLLHSEPIIRISTHVTPLFYLTSSMYKLFSAVPPAAYFSIIQSLWAGIISYCLFKIICDVWPPRAALLLAVTSAFSGPMMAAIGFPHIEIAIPAFSVLFFYGVKKNKLIMATIAILFCLSIREDAGLHIGVVIIMTSIISLLVYKDNSNIKYMLSCGFLSLFYSIIIIIIQNMIFHQDTSSLTRVYFGHPIFAHVTTQFASSQINTFLTSKGYTTLPVLALIVWSLIKRDWYLIIAPLSVLPWLALHVFAVSPGASHLSDYYGFPAILSLCWPTVAPNRPRVWLQAFISLISILLFMTLGSFDKDMTPWKQFGLPPIEAIGRYENALRAAVATERCHGRIMVDDAVAALIPESLKRAEWVHQLFVDNLPLPDGIIFMNVAYDSAVTQKAIEAARLTFRRPIEGTPFIVATAQPACPSK